MDLAVDQGEAPALELADQAFDELQTARSGAIAALLELIAEELTAALARVASAAALPGADIRVARMRGVVAAYLELRLEVRAGMARITLG